MTTSALQGRGRGDHAVFGARSRGAARGRGRGATRHREQVAEEMDDESRPRSPAGGWQLQALQHAAAIEDEDFASERSPAWRSASTRSCTSVRRAVASRMRRADRARHPGRLDAGAGRGERQLKTFEAVVQMETRTPRTRSCTARAGVLRQAHGDARDEIATMHPGAAQETIRADGDGPRRCREDRGGAYVQEEHNQGRRPHEGRLGGRQLREMDQWSSASSRPRADHRGGPRRERKAEKGVHIDRRRGSASTTAPARPGWSGLRRRRSRMAKQLGVPVHDAATGGASEDERGAVEEKPSSRAAGGGAAPACAGSHEGRRAVPAQAPPLRHRRRSPLVQPAHAAEGREPERLYVGPTEGHGALRRRAPRRLAVQEARTWP